jgi:hypothetical protein
MGAWMYPERAAHAGTGCSVIHKKYKKNTLKLQSNAFKRGKIEFV